MFRELLPILEKANLNMEISSVKGVISVTIHPTAKKDQEGFNVAPFSISNATADELDEKLPGILKTATDKIVSFVVNMEAFDASLKAKEAEKKEQAEKKSNTATTSKSTVVKPVVVESPEAKYGYDVKEIVKGEKVRYTGILKMIEDAKTKAGQPDMISFLKKQVIKKAGEMTGNYKEGIIKMIETEFEVIEKLPLPGAKPADTGGLFDTSNLPAEPEDKEDEPGVDDNSNEEEGGEEKEEQEQQEEINIPVEDTKPVETKKTAPVKPKAEPVNKPDALDDDIF